MSFRDIDVIYILKYKDSFSWKILDVLFFNIMGFYRLE